MSALRFDPIVRRTVDGGTLYLHVDARALLDALGPLAIKRASRHVLRVHGMVAVKYVPLNSTTRARSKSPKAVA